MKEKVLRCIKEYGLLDKSKNITVALSGGADSMSLLYVLLSLKDELGIEISAAHLNHMIRGEEADRDENYVISTCKKLGVPLFCKSYDVPLYAKEHALSMELAAREIRYDFLKSVNKGVIATAHTASDNIETVILNLTRGSSAKGLSGIPPIRDEFIRPLLMCTREDVERYCKLNSIEYVTDSTNLCDDYTRNKIRHNIIPILKNINCSVENTVLKTCSLLREDEIYISGLALKFIDENRIEDKLNVSQLDKLDSAVAKRVLRIFIEEKSDVAIDNNHTSQIYSLCFKSGRINIPNNKTVKVYKSFLSVYDNDDNLQNLNSFIVDISQMENKFFKNKEKVNNLLLKNTLDCDKIIGKLNIRTREPGDSIRLKNHNCTKTLKKLYNEYSVLPELRASIPVISDDIGVVWIYGIGVAHRAAISESSKQIFIINVKTAQNN